MILDHYTQLQPGGSVASAGNAGSAAISQERLDIARGPM
jgi:hypothetical protein